MIAIVMGSIARRIVAATSPAFLNIDFSLLVALPGTWQKAPRHGEIRGTDTAVQPSPGTQGVVSFEV
jgi:hypothetical protein